MLRRTILAIFASLAFVVASGRSLAAPDYTGFGPARVVTIQGYSGDAMEPFITRDGRFLIFNIRNDPPERTDLFYA